MKILFITHQYLSSNGGGSFASRAYINSFAECVDSMTLLYPQNSKEDVFDSINKKIVQIPVTYDIPKVCKLLDLLIGRVHRYYDIVPKLLESESYDVVVFDNSKCSYRLIDMAHRHNCKTIVINHNFEYEYVRDNAKGLLRNIELYWTRQYERDAARKSDLNLTLTKQDSKSLCDIYRDGNQDNFRYLGVFEYEHRILNVTPDITNKDISQKRFAITGNLSAVQTVDSLVSWTDSYFSVFRDVFPKAEIIVAGRNPGKKVIDLCEKYGMTLVPSPESMDSVLQNVDYYICPISLGGGMKLRVMDGLRWGIPVIAHSVSVRGYERFIEEKCLFEYNDKESFRKALLDVKNISFSKQVVNDCYKKCFSLNAGIQKVNEILSELK